MNQAPRVSVIIPHLNTPDLLARCIVAVRTSECDALEAMTPEMARRAHLKVF